MGRIHTVRDLTLDRFCWLYTRSAPGAYVYSTTNGVAPEEGWYSHGGFACRIDAMPDNEIPSGAIRRQFGLTLQHDAPKLLQGDLVRIDDLDYRVDTAHDEIAELILRRYTITVPLKEFLAKIQVER